MSALLLVALLIPVNAEASNVGNIEVTQDINSEPYVFKFTPSNGAVEQTEIRFDVFDWHYETIIRSRIETKDGSPIVPKGDKTVTIRGVKTGLYDIYANEYRSCPGYRVLFTYSDSSQEYISASSNDGNGFQTVTDGNRNTTVIIRTNIPKDVVKIEIQMIYGLLYNSTGEYIAYLGEWCSKSSDTNDYSISYEENDRSDGLLNTIISWITNLVESVGDFYTSFTNFVANFCSNLYTQIKEAIESMFVPSVDEVGWFIGDMQELMRDRFGGLYEVIEITYDSWESLSECTVTHYVDFPKVTINLPQNTTFTFGGQKVKVIPEGFEFLATACKLLTGAVCTIMFINGLRKRYDEVMGVEQ